MAEICLIAAMDEGRLIGAAGGLPWRLPADLRRFRQLTMGKPMIMGRKTYDSIGRVLDGRVSIVLTRDRDFRAPGVEIVHDLEEAISVAGAIGTNETMVIGGASIYALTIEHAVRMHLTLIHHRYSGETYFPEYASADWEETAREEGRDERFAHPFSYVTLERRFAPRPGTLK